MTRTKRNPPIRIEGENVILGYYHIVLYMNSNNKVVNINQQLAEKLAAECGRRVEVLGWCWRQGENSCGCTAWGQLVQCGSKWDFIFI